MIRTLLYDPTIGELNRGDQTLLDAAFDDQNRMFWLDLFAVPVAVEQNVLATYLKLPTATIRGFQCLAAPALEKRGRQWFLRLAEPLGDDNDFSFKTTPLGVLVAKRFLVTRHEQESPCIEQLLAHGHDSAEWLSGRPARIAAKLAFLIANRYLRAFSVIQSRLDLLENEKAARPNEWLSKDLLARKDNLKMLHDSAAVHYDLLDRLKSFDLGIETTTQRELTAAGHKLQQGLRRATRDVR